MNRLTFKSLFVIVGLAFSFAAYGQGGGQGGFGGGGGGGFGGGGGGGGFGGGGGGGGFGGGGGGFGDAGGGQQGQAEAPSVEGNWTLEFEIEYDSANPDAGRDSDRLRIRADVTVLSQEVTGRLRGDGEGQFTCTMLDSLTRCDNGRLVIIWDGQDMQQVGTIEFEVDQRDPRRAEGEATFTNNATGAVVVYSIDMRKR